MDNIFDDIFMDPRTQHKIPGMQAEKMGNTFISLDNPDDTMENQTGDNESLMVIDSPDDFEEYFE